MLQPEGELFHVKCFFFYNSKYGRIILHIVTNLQSSPNISSSRHSESLNIIRHISPTNYVIYHHNSVITGPGHDPKRVIFKSHFWTPPDTAHPYRIPS